MYRRAFLTSLTALAFAGCATGSDLRPLMDRSYNLRGLNFKALPDLRVSEENSFYPVADIVWRGDPLGPRVAQIGAMFQEAATRNAAELNGSVPVVVDVTLVRFHGVSERTRLTFGGTWHVVFDLTVRSANGGTVIEPTRRVAGSFRGEGGEREFELEQQGLTQRVRVVNFLTALLREQLT